MFFYPLKKLFTNCKQPPPLGGGCGGGGSGSGSGGGGLGSGSGSGSGAEMDLKTSKTITRPLPCVFSSSPKFFVCAMNAALISAGFNEGAFCSSSAQVPAACGVAIEVPDAVV